MRKLQFSEALYMQKLWGNHDVFGRMLHIFPLKMVGEQKIGHATKQVLAFINLCTFEENSEKCEIYDETSKMCG